MANWTDDQKTKQTLMQQGKELNIQKVILESIKKQFEIVGP